MAFRFLAPCDRPFAEPRDVVSSSSYFVAFASCFFLLFLVFMLNLHKFRRSWCGFRLDSSIYLRLLRRDLRCLLLLRRLLYLQELRRLECDILLL